uniref:Uncharacterized protein n=1 Tax=Anguilla anguilla TaxID=7936 RepID=A0A0E9SVI1_ANGAN
MHCIPSFGKAHKPLEILYTHQILYSTF